MRRRSALTRAGRRLHAADLWLLRRTQDLDSPVADEVLLAASRAANKSKLWFVASAVLAAFGGRRGRRAARRGVLAIALTSTVVYAPLNQSPPWP